jgi:GH24 family phage-related lysozyme (muramidase)
MADYQRDIGGASAPSQTITPKMKPQGGSMVAADILGRFATGAIAGFSSEQMAQDVRQATGLSVGQEQVDKNVSDFTSAMQKGTESGKITPENYNQMADEYLGGIESDAKTIHKLVKNKQLSPLYGEALTRRKVSAAMANPFWAALGGRVTDAAGPLGGGRDVAQSAFATQEQRDLYAMAESEREALSKYRDKVNEITLNTGWEPGVVQKHIQARAQFEEMQKTEAATIQDSVNRQVSGDYFSLTEEMTKRINPETQTIDAIGLQEIESLIATKEADFIGSIQGTYLTDGEKKAKIEAAKMQYEGIRAMAQSRSLTKTAEGINKQNLQQLTLAGDQMDPSGAYYAAKGNQAMMGLISYMSTDQKKFEYERMFPGAKDPSDIAVGMKQTARLFGQDEGSFQPAPAVSLALGAPTSAQGIKEGAEKDPKFFQKIAQQTSRYPSQTLQGLRSGPIPVEAARGDEAAQQTLSSSVNAAVAQVQADMALMGVSGGISIVTRKPGQNAAVPFVEKAAGAVAGLFGVEAGKQELVIPDDIPGDRAAQIKEVYQMVKVSPWMWPKGATTAQEAFEDIINNGRPVTPQSVRDAEGSETEPMEVSPLKTYKGDMAVKIVEQKEGMLSPIEKQIVKDEGYRSSEYLDTKGIPTRGVGQTGDYMGMPFKQVAKAKMREVDRLFPEIGTYPEEVQAALYSAGYRGDITGSPKAIQLINEGSFTEAAKEFLNNEEYKNAPPGIKERMNRTAAAIRKLAETNEVEE